MSVHAFKPYPARVMDGQDKFHGNQVLYVGWVDHLMFCAPLAFALAPDFPFGDLIKNVLPGAYSYHPDFAQIDWSAVQWYKSGVPFTPRLEESLVQNGLGHKDLITFVSPGLTGIKGTCS
jgi:phenol hydroxylase P4 protein